MQFAININYCASFWGRHSFDLVTVAQALHWFKFDDFYTEVKRVAKPNAIFAAWIYSLLRISKEIDALIEAHPFNTPGNYWDVERKYVDEEYSSIPFPFTKIHTPAFVIQYEWALEHLEGYIYTWSGLHKFILANQYNPVDELMIRIKSFWNQEKMKISFPGHLLMERIIKEGCHTCVDILSFNRKVWHTFMINRETVSYICQPNNV